LSYLILFIILIGGALASIITQKLTVSGAVWGSIFGFLLYKGAGWTGVLLMAVFFLLGTMATSWKYAKKEQLGIAENKGRRNAGQVMANGGVAAMLALFAWIFPQEKVLFQSMIAAAFSSSTADTLSSELGSLYGKSFYNILSFKKDKRGLDGVVSREGIFFGIAGSCIIALIYCIGPGESRYFLWIVIAGTMGNLSDSLLGAAFERKGFLKNDAVNFLNTAIAATIMWLLFLVK
jgi:uncharacterized protein (TIGR00297 family)